MSKNWKRKIQVIFDTRAITLDDFDIAFMYSFNVDEEPNEIEVEIKNLSRTTINSYIGKDKQLIVNAGYEGDVGNIAKGYIIDTDTGWNNVDKDTHILGFDASEDYLNKKVMKTYKAGTMALSIVRDICSMSGLAIGEVVLKKNVQYTRGLSVTGRIRDILKEIIVNDCETNLQIKNGTIIIRDIGQGVESGFILSSNTGLIGSPEPITDVDDTIPIEKRPDYSVRCLLNYKIGPMSKIKIKSKVLEANAIVISGKHLGSKDGAFETQMEVKLV